MDNSLTRSKSTSVRIDLKRIIALWGFSEAALGGMLHALKVPFTGLFIGSAAVIFITLLSHYSENKIVILKGVLTVILIKAIISPYTPLAAYFAVLLQAVLGYLFFSYIKPEKLAAVMLGFFALLFSALQKIIILTILFGFTLWESFDEFVEYVLAQLKVNAEGSMPSFSLIIVIVYVAIHIVSGIYIGMRAGGMPQWLEGKRKILPRIDLAGEDSELLIRSNKKKKKWWQRPSGIVLISLLILITAFSYLTPEGSNGLKIPIMIIRSLLILFLWFEIISPYVSKHFKKYVDKEKFERASEINSITAYFPKFRTIINYSWKENSKLSGIRRIRNFLSDSLAYLLITDLDE